MRKLLAIGILLLSLYSFSQDLIYQNEKTETDNLVNSIDSNQDKFQIKIEEGEIIYNNNKNGGWSSINVIDYNKVIVKIEEYISTDNYTTYKFYYSNDNLKFLHFKKENYKRKNIELLEDCSVYVFKNELIYVPINQTKYCKLNYSSLIEYGKQRLEEQYKSIKE